MFNPFRIAARALSLTVFMFVALQIPRIAASAPGPIQQVVQELMQPVQAVASDFEQIIADPAHALDVIGQAVTPGGGF